MKAEVDRRVVDLLGVASHLVRPDNTVKSGMMRAGARRGRGEGGRR